MRRRYASLLLPGLLASSPVAAAEHVPLERQFFDYFNDRCVQSMNGQLQQQSKDPQAAPYRDGIASYCSCTAQALVSWLDAGEIVQFAEDPTLEPGASKIRPYFLACRDKVRQAIQ